jgi:predicted nucleic-acid-binding protein
VAALDTNVVIRLLTGDDAKQVRAAEKLLRNESCTVSLSVLMECEWVLRGCYGLDANTINASLRAFLELEQVASTEPVLAVKALDAHAAGVDLADAIHTVQKAEGERFATFDKPLVRSASRAGLRGVTLIKT